MLSTGVDRRRPHCNSYQGRRYRRLLYRGLSRLVTEIEERDSCITEWRASIPDFPDPQAGALMLADNSICCIDEFDKMDGKDQASPMWPRTLAETHSFIYLGRLQSTRPWNSKQYPSQRLALRYAIGCGGNHPVCLTGHLLKTTTRGLWTPRARFA